jgi:hypothetical protein
MTTYTKKTIVTYLDTVDNVSAAYVSEVLTKITQLVSEEKTDGTYSFDPTYHKSIRTWVDQSAAEEWVNFITALANTDLVDITDIQIVDVPL